MPTVGSQFLKILPVFKFTCPWPYRALPVTVPCPVRDCTVPVLYRTVPYQWPYGALLVTVPCPVRDPSVLCLWPYRALLVTVPCLSVTVRCPARDRTVPCPWSLVDTAVTAQWKMRDSLLIATWLSTYVITVNHTTPPREGAWRQNSTFYISLY